MKNELDNLILHKWKKIVSKLSKPIISKSAFFSQETAQLIFIFLFFITISNTLNVIEFSQTLSGHITVVFILFYFTLIHPMVGAILSMAMILYYHSDLVKAYYYESILYKNTPSTVRENMDKFELSDYRDIQRRYDSDKRYFKQLKQQYEKETKLFHNQEKEWHTEKKTHQDYIDKILKPKNQETFQNMEASTLSSAYPFTTNVHTISSKYSPLFRPMYFNEHQLREGFESNYSEVEQPTKIASNYSHYRSTYEQPLVSGVPYSIRQNEVSHDIIEAKEEARRNALFRQEHCKAGQLMNKDSVVKPSMAEFVFPSLQIEGSQDGHPCNPCNPYCNIHVSKLDHRLDTERILQQRNHRSLQKTSNNWVPSWFDIFLPHPVFQKPSGNISSQRFAKPANKPL